MEVVLSTMVGGTLAALILTFLVRALIAKRFSGSGGRAAVVGAIVYVTASVLWAFGEHEASQPLRIGEGFALYFFPTLLVTLWFAWRDERRLSRHSSANRGAP